MSEAMKKDVVEYWMQRVAGQQPWHRILQSHEALRAENEQWRIAAQAMVDAEDLKHGAYHGRALERLRVLLAGEPAADEALAAAKEE